MSEIIKTDDNRKRLAISTIERWLRDSDCDVREAAMQACKGRTDIPLYTIERGLRDSDCDVRAAAMRACEGRTDIPPAVIEWGLRDSDCDVRAAAMRACEGRTDIPLDTIERGLHNSDWRVRAAAMQACEGRTDIPVIRTFEPPELVYKECVGGVIVVAHIPADAQIRGKMGGKCRASKAIINEIIGDVCGEPVGISLYDKSTLYYAGDEVVIQDFDYSNAECGAGFHFFCSREEAEKYEP